MEYHIDKIIEALVDGPIGGTDKRTDLLSQLIDMVNKSGNYPEDEAELMFNILFSGQWHKEPIFIVCQMLEKNGLTVKNAMKRGFTLIDEQISYYEKVKIHNLEVQSLLELCVDEIQKLTEYPIIPMGSRGYGWKTIQTNYIESDFETAVVAPQTEHVQLMAQFKSYYENLGYTVRALETKAGLCFMEIKYYKFSQDYSNKLEICFQTTEQNNAIKENYLNWLSSVGESRIAWYISSIRDAYQTEDLEKYNSYKTWLRVLPSK